MMHYCRKLEEEVEQRCNFDFLCRFNRMPAGSTKKKQRGASFENLVDGTQEIKLSTVSFRIGAEVLCATSCVDVESCD